MRTAPRKMELRRMLRPGQRVRVHGLCPAVDGMGATVVGMIERGVDSDPITTEGWWTVADHRGLRRDFQRRHLRADRR